MDREQYEALTAEDLDWLRKMGWRPRFEWLRGPDGLLRFPFLPTISAVEAPTSAELRAGVAD